MFITVKAYGIDKHIPLEQWNEWVARLASAIAHRDVVTIDELKFWICWMADHGLNWQKVHLAVADEFVSYEVAVLATAKQLMAELRAN